ncbi:glycosyltransferase [bacterium]|nr:glycosyltransferase [bacterium]
MKMINDLLVSTIIPTFQRAQCLKRAINSVLNQTYQNIEVVVVDDNDPVTEFRLETENLMSFYSNDKRVRYIKHEKNKNGAAARNTGILHAKGEIICFLDDDDWFLPQKIKIQLDKLISNKSFDGVYCGRMENGVLVTLTVSGDLKEQILLSEFIPATSTLMIYKSCLEDIGGFNINYRRHQDSELLLRFFKKYQIYSIPRSLIIMGPNKAENELHGKALEQLKNSYLAEFDEKINEINVRNKNFKKKVFASHFVKVFFDHLQNQHFILAVKIFFRLITNSAFFFMQYSWNHVLQWVRVNYRKHK